MHKKGNTYVINAKNHQKFYVKSVKQFHTVLNYADHNVKKLFIMDRSA